MTSVNVGRYGWLSTTVSAELNIVVASNFFKLDAHSFLPSFSLWSVPKTL